MIQIPTALISLLLLSMGSVALQDCESDPTPQSTQSPDSSPTPQPTESPNVGEDLFMTGDDFECIQSGTKVDHFYLWNELGHLDEALAIANSPTGGTTYPIGTIIQLIPTEAMVKRFEGFSPESNDWEYFWLDVNGQTTTVLDRGADNEEGPLGVQNAVLNCHDCHKGAEPQWDLVCSEGHGCDPLPFNESMIETIQDSDPRCQ